MNRFPLPTLRLRTGYALLAAFVIFGAYPLAIAQVDTTDPEFQAYLDRVAELNRDGRALVQEHGKDYLISAYQALVDANPGYQKNVQLETRIGEIYEWDFSNRGEPPDINSAYAVYLDIVNRYDLDYEYTKLVYRRAADRAENIDPAAASDLYVAMMQAYPNDPVVQLESLYRLGALAERDGDINQARELFDQVLGYDAKTQALNPDQAERIEVLQSQAASLLMALATDPAATPEERLAALDAFLEGNPALLDEHGDVAENIRTALNRLQNSEPRDEVREAMAELKNMLAQRQEAREQIDAPAGDEPDEPTRTSIAAGRDPAWQPAGEGTSPQEIVAKTGPVDATIVDTPSPRAFAGLQSSADSAAPEDGTSNASNRAAAMAAATVCALLAAVGLFALRKRFGQ
jgi:hypothetical protein